MNYRYYSYQWSQVHKLDINVLYLLSICSVRNSNLSRDLFTLLFFMSSFDFWFKFLNKLSARLKINPLLHYYMHNNIMKRYPRLLSFLILPPLDVQFVQSGWLHDYCHLNRPNSFSRIQHYHMSSRTINLWIINKMSNALIFY